MPAPLYDYIAQFGVERWKEVAGQPNGGAELSNDNLIITLWALEDKSTGGSSDPYTFGDLLIQRYVSDSVQEDNRPAFQQGMHGRVASRFYLNTDNDPGFNADNLIAVCAPPQELKQQLQNSVVFNGGDPLDTNNYSFTKSHQGQFTWKAWESQAEGPQGTSGGPNAWVLEDGQYLSGQYIPLNILASPDPSYLPLLRTSGADGVTPTAFNMTTAAGVAECIAAVNRGNFFWPMLLNLVDVLTPDGAYFDVIWPYSASRG